MKSVNVLKKSHFIDYVKFLFKTFLGLEKNKFLKIENFLKKMEISKSLERSKKLGIFKKFGIFKKS